MIELRGISTGYGGTPVVHDIDLTVEAGEIVTLVGANGAGKSTLVKTISGLLRPLRGQILFEGKRIETLSSARSRAAGNRACAGRASDLRRNDGGRKSGIGGIPSPQTDGWR